MIHLDVKLIYLAFPHLVPARILDLLILQDKTLFGALEASNIVCWLVNQPIAKLDLFKSPDCRWICKTYVEYCYRNSATVRRLVQSPTLQSTIFCGVHTDLRGKGIRVSPAWYQSVAVVIFPPDLEWGSKYKIFNILWQSMSSSMLYEHIMYSKVDSFLLFSATLNVNLSVYRVEEKTVWKKSDFFYTTSGQCQCSFLGDCYKYWGIFANTILSNQYLLRAD